MREPQVKSIRALARGIEVLQMVQVSGAVSLNDLHRMSGIPKASLLRILKTLIEQGVVWQRIVDNAYIASYSLSELASHMDREIQLVEVASPILEGLSDEVKWPSVLAVPRLTHMEVIETNAPRSYFHHIQLGPVGFQINMLRSAAGRAYIAFCEDAMRDAILNRLRRSGRKGDWLAADEKAIQQIIHETREQGFGLRSSDFGGHFDEGRGLVDDGRDSIGVPIRLGRHVPGTINVTWVRWVMGRTKAIDLLAERVQRAARDIANALARSHEGFTA